MGRLYEPSWWERRFPWMLDALAAMDPDPLTARIHARLEPVARLAGRAAEPLAEILDRLGVAAGGILTAVGDTGALLVRAVPLPGPLRRWLWIDAPRRQGDGFDHAQMALKRQYAVLVPLALTVAVPLHAALLLLAPVPVSVAVADPAPEELIAIHIPPTVDIPPPPGAIPRPEAPLLSGVVMEQEITVAAPIVPEAFLDDMPALPPPPVERPVEDVPTLDNLSVYAVILNREEVSRLLLREYPRKFRDAGIGGVVDVAALIDTSGAVEEVRVLESSGYDDLDEAALRVAQRIRCSPAVQADRKVAAWVRTRIEFRVR